LGSLPEDKCWGKDRIENNQGTIPGFDTQL